MALFLTLMFSAWQEFITLVLTQWNRISACLALAANQRLDGAVAAWAVSHALWISWARAARAIVASFFAVVLSAVEFVVADLSTGEFWAATGRLSLLLAAVALQGDDLGARGTRTVMAVSLAFMDEAV